MFKALCASLLGLFLLSSCSSVRDYLYPHASKVDGVKPKKVGIEEQKNSKQVTLKNVQLESKKADTIKKVTKVTKPNLSVKVSEYCNKVDYKFKKYRWGKSLCSSYDWHHVRNSYLGDPLIWKTYGNESDHKKSHKETTMIFCGVHGDEITPIKFCFDILKHVESHKHLFVDRMVVIAPIVNPDSFFKRRPTRTNARGVDVNRNFPTKDWNAKALKTWKHRYRSDPRRYPGTRPFSEQETIFQANLIKRYSPNKIISIHSPLTLLDYDGPEIQTANNDDVGKVAHILLTDMSKLAKGYRVKNYPFFPGSLGNWAGNERKIPTYTLELPTSDPSKSDQYWKLFKEAIITALSSDFKPTIKAPTQFN